MKNSASFCRGPIAFVVTASILLLSSLTVQAQLEEIIVTAQKRTENVQDVPIAISAFTAESMQAKGLTNVSQLADFTPNVEMDYTSPFAGSSNVLSPFIRGIGQNDFAFNLEPGVGVYVDGVYFARTIGAVVDLLDLDHIEILKGPQGTLFGRNTIGGALNIITRRPADEFAWKGELTTGRYDRVDIRGAVDMPIIPGKLLATVAFSSKNRDGYQTRIPFPGAPGQPVNFRTDEDKFLRARNITHDKSGNEDQDNIRGKLLWLVNDDLEVTIAADYTRVDEQATPTTLLAVNSGPTSGTIAALYNACIDLPADPVAGAAFNAMLGLPAGTVPDLTTLGLFTVCNTPIANSGAILTSVNIDADPSNDRLIFTDDFVTGDIDTTFAKGSNFSIMDTWGVSATVDWVIRDGLKLKSISAYRKLFAQHGLDFSSTPFVGGDVTFDTKQEQFTHELQLSGLAFDDRLNWLLGAYYFHEEGDLTDFVPFVGGLIQVFGQNFFDNDAYAFFTHLNYSITERISFTVGLRYTDETKEFEGKQKDLNAFPSKVGFPAALHPDPTDLTRIFPLGVNKKSFNDLSTRFGVEYRFTEDIMSYFSFSEGFKTGGWTTRLLVPEVTATGQPGPAPEFDEETATSFEVGIKSQWFDNRLQVNLAGFFTDYEGIQITVQEGVSPTFKNAGDGEIMGFEAEFTGLVTDNLTVTGSLGYMDAEYTSLLPGAIAAGVDLDDKFVNTPDWSIHLGGDYLFPLAHGGTLGLHVDYSFKDIIANDAVNTPLLMQDPIHLVNLSATYTAPSEKWQISAGGRNITDERYIFSGFDQTGIGFTTANYSRPAEWFLTLRFNN